MSERERNQRGLKRRKRSYATSMRSTVILKVSFLFVCCIISYKMHSMNSGQDSFIDCLIFVFSARFSGDSAAVTQQQHPHSAPGGDAAGAYGSGGQC